MARKVLLKINAFSTVTLYQQVADELAEYILSGRLSPGERLPSIRALARQLRLSIDTIKQALKSLSERGLVCAFQGSGYYVSKTIELPAVQSDTNHREPAGDPDSLVDSKQLDSTIDWSYEAGALTRAFNEHPINYQVRTEVEYDFRHGDPSMQLLQGSRWSQAIRLWCKDYLVQPGTSSGTAGIPQLRQEVAQWLKRTRGIDCAARDVFITSGLEHARDLVARLLVNRGSEVVVEDPCCASDILAYMTQGAELIHVPQDEQGIDTTSLREVRTADVAHISSGASFPAGVTLSLERSRALLDWAAENNVIIVEDSSAAGYSYRSTQASTLYALAKERENGPPVIYVGSLSQHLLPAVRLGFVVLPANFQLTLLRTNWVAERHPSAITQGLVLTLMNEGLFEQHALRLIESVNRKRKSLLAAIGRWPAGLISFTPVEAGFQQPIWFNEQMDDQLISQLAMAQGIAVSPTSVHFSSAQPRSGLCLGFSRLTEEIVTRALDKLLAIILACKPLDFSVVRSDSHLDVVPLKQQVSLR